MMKVNTLLGLLVVLALAPGTADARGYGRGGGNVNTPFGSFNGNEMRAAGGNPFMAEEFREERMMQQYQQQMMKEMQKEQKAYQEYLKKNPGAAAVPMQPVTRQKKKRRTYVPKEKTASAPSEKTQSK